MSCRHACLCRKTLAVSRVAGYLLSQHRGLCCPENRTCPLERIPTTLNISPMALTANELCLARETFSRALSQLQRNNLIRISHGEVELIDIGRLKQVSGIANECLTPPESLS
jgi:CRP-like cAMP-binding protein